VFDGSDCFRCKELADPPPVTIRSYTTYHGPIREAIHRFKYQKDIALCESLAIYLIELFNIYKWEVDLIIPVPLSQERQKERGYNQSTLLARPFSFHFKIPLSTTAISRSLHTNTQVGLSARDRQNNLFKAFTAQTEQVSGKKILVIDDVATTSATLNATANTLVNAGAKKVYGLTLARSILQHKSNEEV
jgi:ComF family protein